MTDAPVAAPARRRRKSRDGVVVGDKMTKTVVVQVQEMKAHALYKKVVRRTRRFLAHDERGECGLGDRVRIAETRPLSRRKRWRVAAVLEKAK